MITHFFKNFFFLNFNLKNKPWLESLSHLLCAVAGNEAGIWVLIWPNGEARDFQNILLILEWQSTFWAFLLMHRQYLYPSNCCWALLSAFRKASPARGLMKTEHVQCVSITRDLNSPVKVSFNNRFSSFLDGAGTNVWFIWAQHHTDPFLRQIG